MAPSKKANPPVRLFAFSFTAIGLQRRRCEGNFII
jgi:hypothetical protein